jgi:hypothetical protein
MMPGWDETVVATYQQRRPNVRIDLVPQTGPTIDRIEKLRALTAAGSPPHLGDGPQGPQVMAPQGVLDPAMDDLMAGKVAVVPMLQSLKPQLQNIVDGT